MILLYNNRVGRGVKYQAFRRSAGRTTAGRKVPGTGLSTSRNRILRPPLASLLLVVGALFVFMAGCGGMRPTYYKSQGFDVEEIKKVAVLPLDSLAADRNAGERFRMAIIAEMLSEGVDVVEPGEVIRVMVDLEIKSLRGLSVEEIQDIGERLGADSVMTGSVGSYAMRKGAKYSYPDVSINLVLYEVSSGEIVWSVWHSTGGATFSSRYFGTEGRTLNEAVREVVKEAINVLF
ncbi:MAG: hypothetical protein PVJ36_00345 [Nitrospirota bacterium]|jgi:hypothetical protein